MASEGSISGIELEQPLLQAQLHLDTLDRVELFHCIQEEAICMQVPGSDSGGREFADKSLEWICWTVSELLF